MDNFNLPNLTSGNHTLTSSATPRYNCVSHALHEDLVSLWPDDDNRWPTHITRAETVEAFVEFFMDLGFSEIPISDTAFVLGYEKIAIFAENGMPLHVARQLNSGRWTSKFGVLVDISHVDLHSIEHGQFGRVAKLMRRIQTNRPPKLPDLTPPRPLIIT